MAFIMNCDNKGCGQQQTPYLDPKENKVYCSLCDREIASISSFAKNQMKSLKQFKVKQVVPYSVKCQRCGREDKPKLLKNEVVCAACSAPLNHLSIPFKNMLKDRLSKKELDD